MVSPSPKPPIPFPRSSALRRAQVYGSSFAADGCDCGDHPVAGRDRQPERRVGQPGEPQDASPGFTLSGALM